MNKLGSRLPVERITPGLRVPGNRRTDKDLCAFDPNITENHTFTCSSKRNAFLVLL